MSSYIEPFALGVGYVVVVLGVAWFVLAVFVFLLDRIVGHLKLLNLLTKAVYRRPKEEVVVQAPKLVAVNKYPDAVDE